ncbi:Uncharacterized conserved protein YecT, DUF1311 family [Paraburkholderia aspalathi]|uniref:Uncharacterized conserved protein YecT, DUF1311 family n=2 Tax=Paraburkholderia aspalathi TaxID=1324617 RepID=A0A1I7EIX2_9BURK|nr:Uncharacterized conserved protein YecT, DUF1311 family [Paraburkholderia aspalathi]
MNCGIRPGHAGASIAGPHCLDKPGGVRIAPDCLRNYGLSAFLPFSNFHALPVMRRAEQKVSFVGMLVWRTIGAPCGGSGRRFLLDPLLLMVLAVPIASAQKKVDPIEAQVEACLGTPTGQTTAGMTDCSHKAYLAYDRRMNDVYQRTMRNADPQSRMLIRNAQRQWLAYRDAQRQADNGPWRADRGSMASADIEALNVDAIRARIDELNYYAP